MMNDENRRMKNGLGRNVNGAVFVLSNSYAGNMTKGWLVFKNRQTYNPFRLTRPFHSKSQRLI
jgi:hypothetical protein